ncbi:hypothetical protein MRB53_023223 [Persea americana]|uniref:Uncharacterized protein n=1 Tax=Persea americana TaxID=3435 RepID=A0ACC2L9G2_PERAE|nr:hypothetical protein MRB53_023223 [Persea americana]
MMEMMVRPREGLQREGDSGRREKMGIEGWGGEGFIERFVLGRRRNSALSKLGSWILARDSLQIREAPEDDCDLARVSQSFCEGGVRGDEGGLEQRTKNSNRFHPSFLQSASLSRIHEFQKVHNQGHFRVQMPLHLQLSLGVVFAGLLYLCTKKHGQLLMMGARRQSLLQLRKSMTLATGRPMHV